MQTLLDYGGPVFEGEEPLPSDRAWAIPGVLDDLEALRLIFVVNERAQFEFVLSENSLREVAAKRDARYTQWALDVLDVWQIRVEECRGDYLSPPVRGEDPGGHGEDLPRRRAQSDAGRRRTQADDPAGRGPRLRRMSGELDRSILPLREPAPTSSSRA